MKTATDRLHHYIVVSLLTGARAEELRSLRWEHVHLEGCFDTLGETLPRKWRSGVSVREGVEPKTPMSRRTLAADRRGTRAVGGDR